MLDHDCNQEDLDASAADMIIRPKAPVVMVVGPFASGVEELAALLAEQLHLPLYDPNKLDALARDYEKHGHAWEHLKQGRESFFDYWLGHLHGQPGMGRIEHLRSLEHILQRVAEEGGVIVGVCIHHMLPGEKLFRIKLEASVNHCAHRLVQLRHCSTVEAVAAFYHMEDEHSRFLDSLFEELDSAPLAYDLELDAERLTPRMMLQECLTAMGHRHFSEQAA